MKQLNFIKQLKYMKELHSIKQLKYLKQMKYIKGIKEIKPLKNEPKMSGGFYFKNVFALKKRGAKYHNENGFFSQKVGRRPTFCEKKTKIYKYHYDILPIPWYLTKKAIFKRFSSCEQYKSNALFSLAYAK